MCSLWYSDRTAREQWRTAFAPAAGVATSVGGGSRLSPRRNVFPSARSRRCSARMQLTPMDPGFVSTLPKSQQGLVTLGVSVGIAMGTVLLVDKVVPAMRLVPGAKIASRLIGPLYILTGLGHFTMVENFIEVMPEQGQWGWWYLPGSPKFHVYWTGVAEIVGGIAVMLGDLSFMPQWVGPTASACLFLLTAAVTPANIKSMTHGLSGPLQGITIPVPAQVARALLQSVFLALFWSLATGYRI